MLGFFFFEHPSIWRVCSDFFSSTLPFGEFARLSLWPKPVARHLSHVKVDETRSRARPQEDCHRGAACRPRLSKGAGRANDEAHTTDSDGSSKPRRSEGLPKRRCARPAGAKAIRTYVYLCPILSLPVFARRHSLCTRRSPLCASNESHPEHLIT